MEVKREYYLNWLDEVLTVVIIDTGMYYGELSVDVITDDGGYGTRYVSGNIEKCCEKAEQYLSEIRERKGYNHMAMEKGFTKVK